MNSKRFFGRSVATLAMAIAAAALGLASLFGPSALAGDQRPTIVAVGDLHGDYGAYQTILKNAGLIDAKGKWSGGDAILVQLGDIPDRGPDTRKIIENMMALEKQAKKKRGRVVALIGNHEAMNVTGDLRYVTPEEFSAFKTSKSAKYRDSYFKARRETLEEFYRGKDPAMTPESIKAAFEEDVPLGFLEHRTAWSAKGSIGAWVSSHNAVEKIGDTLFLHGGVSTAYSARSIEDINQAVRIALRGGEGAILEDEQGPLWFRGLAAETDEGAAALEAALAAYDVKRIVIGHTPQLEGVRTLYDGRVIIADTGASKSYGGTRSFVRIDETGVTANDNGVDKKIEEGAE